MTQLLERGSPAGRKVLATVTLGSGIALLDGTVVNIAVKAIGEDLGAGMAELQWVLNGYLLALASLILLGGALGDRYGRRRLYLGGVAGFGVASALCLIAQSPEQLIGFRVLQGVAAALLTPGSLAILQSSFRPRDRAAVIGTWAGLSGVAAAAGPLLGGLLLDHGGWRGIFALNLPLCALVLWLGRSVPESQDEESAGDFDVVGAALAVLALASLTYLLTFWPTLGAGTTLVLGAVVVGLWLGFVLWQRRPNPLVPLSLFTSRVFAAANLMTFLVYGALGAVLFFLVLQLQVTTGFSALGAGMSTLPITLMLLLLSSRSAVLAARIGPRVPMTVGPLLCAMGVALLAGVDAESTYWLGVLPGVLLFALGLAALVSPLTAAVLASAPDRRAGVASGVNNAVARTGSLLAVAALPALVGVGGAEYQDPELLTEGYRTAQWLSALLLTAGGIVSWFGLAGTAPAHAPGPEPDDEVEDDWVEDDGDEAGDDELAEWEGLDEELDDEHAEERA